MISTFKHHDISKLHCTAIVELLLQYGADTNIPDDHGCVPLMQLVRLFNQSDCNRLVSLLTSYGANTYQLDKDNDNMFTEYSKNSFLYKVQPSYFTNSFIILLKTINSIDVSFSSKIGDTIFGCHFFDEYHFDLSHLKLICLVSNTKEQLFKGLCTKSKYRVKNAYHEYTPLTMAVSNKQFSALNFLFMNCGSELFQYHEELHPGMLLKTAIDVACPKTVAFFLSQIKLDISKSREEILSHIKRTVSDCEKQKSSKEQQQSFIARLLSENPLTVHPMSKYIDETYSVEYDPYYTEVEFGNIDFFTSFHDEIDGVSYLQKIVDGKASTCSDHEFLLHCLVKLNFYQQWYSNYDFDRFVEDQKLSLLNFFLKKEPLNLDCINILLISGVNICYKKHFASDMFSNCASESHSLEKTSTSEMPQKRQKTESKKDEQIMLLLTIFESRKCDLPPILSHFKSGLDQLFTILIDNHRMDVFNRLIQQVIKEDISKHEVSNHSDKGSPQKKQKNMTVQNIKWIVDLFGLFIQKNCFSGVKIILSNSIEFSTDDWRSIAKSLGSFGTPPMINYLLDSSVFQEIFSQYIDDLLQPLMLSLFKNTEDTILLNSFCSKILYSSYFCKDEMITYFVALCFQLSDTEAPIHFLEKSDLLSGLRQVQPAVVLKSPLVKHLKSLFEYLLKRDKNSNQDFIKNNIIYYSSFFNTFETNPFI